MICMCDRMGVCVWRGLLAVSEWRVFQVWASCALQGFTCSVCQCYRYMLYVYKDVYFIL